MPGERPLFVLSILASAGLLAIAALASAPPAARVVAVGSVAAFWTAAFVARRM